MAAFVQTRFVNNYIDRVKLGDRKRILDSVYEASAEAQQAVNQLLQQPDFIIDGTTDSNTAAASSPVISLSDFNVSFPANTVRDVFVSVVAANGSDRFCYTTKQKILGGTDPTLLGPEQYLTSNRARLVATLSSGTATTVAAESLAPEWWDGAQPAAGAFSSGASIIQWLGANSAVRFLTPLGAVIGGTSVSVSNAMAVDHKVTSLTNGTSTLTTFTINGTEAATNPPDGRIVAEAIVVPPVYSPVLIDTVSTPDEVFIGALGISADLVTWNFRITVGDAVQMALL